MNRITGMLAGATVLTILALAAGAQAATPFVNWQAYLFNTRHSSFNAAAGAITTANAGSLVRAWTWVPPRPTMPGQPAATLAASPTVYRGVVYIGANSGVFFAVSEATGAIIWQRFVAFTPKLTCNAAKGFTSTATVANDPTTGRPTVYVGAADGYLYALDAATGAIDWRALVAAPSPTVNDYYLWGSPTVSGGKVYIGISSQCDNPLVRAGVDAFSQTDGTLLATYYTVPSGSVGGSVWSTPAVATSGDVLVTTGNAKPKSPNPGDSTSIVRLDGNLVKQDIWTVPQSQLGNDDDFGASPTIFQATIGSSKPAMVGACNKNGNFYALRLNQLSAGPVWTFQVGVPFVNTTGEQCIAAAVWDGKRLFVAGNGTTIGGTSYFGSVRELDPATGTPIWETGLPGAVMGTPTLDGAGVLAAASYDVTPGSTNAAYLIDASTGSILATLSTSGATEFAQPVFADGNVLLATNNKGLIDYRAP
jgi:outer membrane protein assembly factor BamB